MPLLHFILSRPFIRCQYYWSFPVPRKMTTLALPGSKVGSPVIWSITDLSSPTGLTRGDDFLGVEVWFLMFATWFDMRSCSWRHISHVLYLCSCDTLGVSDALWCAAGVMGSVFYGMIWGARWGGLLVARPGHNYISSCGSTLRGVTGAASGFASEVCTLRGGVSWWGWVGVFQQVAWGPLFACPIMMWVV